MSLDSDNSLSIVVFDTPIRSAICLIVILGFTFIRLIILSGIEEFWASFAVFSHDFGFVVLSVFMLAWACHVEST